MKAPRLWKRMLRMCPWKQKLKDLGRHWRTNKPASIIKPVSVVWICLWPTHFQNVPVFQRGCKRHKGAKIPLSSDPFIIYDYIEKLEGNVSQQRFLLTLGRRLGYKTITLKQRTLRSSAVKSSWVNPLGSSACSQGMCPHPTAQRKQAGSIKFSFRSPSLSHVNTV